MCSHAGFIAPPGAEHGAWLRTLINMHAPDWRDLAGLREVHAYGFTGSSLVVPKGWEREGGRQDEHLELQGD